LDKIKGKGKYYVRLHILKILYENKYLFLKKNSLIQRLKKNIEELEEPSTKLNTYKITKKKLLFKRCSLNEIKDKRY
jgi:tRNA(Phe) wybutosine-synthesizing methylase Tyw3